MPDAYMQLLDATIQRLQSMKDRGVRFVSVLPENLAALAQAPKSSPSLPKSNPLNPSVSPNGGEGRVEGTSAAIQNSSDPAKQAAFAELRTRAMVCVKCPHLASSRKNVVFGVGNI